MRLAKKLFDMTILGKLYSIVGETHPSESKADYDIRLDANDIIFKAHFPNEPILPGACITQMVLELYERWTGRNADISRIGNLKFLSAISPAEETELTVSIEKADTNDQTDRIKASITHAAICHAKMSMDIIYH